MKTLNIFTRAQKIAFFTVTLIFIVALLSFDLSRFAL